LLLISVVLSASVRLVTNNATSTNDANCPDPATSNGALVNAVTVGTDSCTLIAGTNVQVTVFNSTAGMWTLSLWPTAVNCTGVPTVGTANLNKTSTCFRDSNGRAWQVGGADNTILIIVIAVIVAVVLIAILVCVCVQCGIIRCGDKYADI